MNYPKKCDDKDNDKWSKGDHKNDNAHLQGRQNRKWGANQKDWFYFV